MCEVLGSHQSTDVSRKPLKLLENRLKGISDDEWMPDFDEEYEDSISMNFAPSNKDIMTIKLSQFYKALRDIWTSVKSKFKINMKSKVCEYYAPSVIDMVLEK